MNILARYYWLTKPGIIYGNTWPLIAGYLFAAGFNLDLTHFLVIILSTMLIIASACVYNNIIDADIDAYMKRTESRSTVSGVISLSHVVIYATVLYIIGLTGLLLVGNVYVLVFALIGHLGYVAAYTYSKRITHHSTLIGAIPGAMPPLIGYAAVTNYLDLTALLLFLSLVFWQMPHFYAIALRRQSEYEKATIPLLPIVKGTARTVFEMKLYGTLFLVTLIGLYFQAELSPLFIIPIGLAAYWLLSIYRVVNTSSKSAKKPFLISLLMIILWSVFISIEGIIRAI